MHMQAPIEMTGLANATTFDDFSDAIINSTNTDERITVEGVEVYGPTGDAVSFVRAVCVFSLSVAGAITNIFILIAIIPNRSLRVTFRNKLLVHLGALGLSTSLLIGIYSGVVLLHGYWIGGDVVCNIFGLTLSILTEVTLWTLTALSWDKFKTITDPLSDFSNKKYIILYFGLSWLCSILLALPPVFGVPEHVFHEGMGFCTIDFKDRSGKIYSVIFCGLVCIIPLGVTIYCYAHIFKIARTHRRRIAATVFSVVNLFQTTVPTENTTQENHNPKPKSRNAKAIGTILQYVGIYLVCYVPFFGVKVVEIVTEETVNEFVVAIATILFQSAPVFNGCVHGLKNKVLRDSFYRYVAMEYRLLFYKDKRTSSSRSLSRRNLGHIQSFRLKLSPKFGSLRRTQSYHISRNNTNDFLDIPRNLSFNVNISRDSPHVQESDVDLETGTPSMQDSNESVCANVRDNCDMVDAHKYSI